MSDDFFVKILYIFLTLFLSLAFVVVLGMTIVVYKRDILNQDEYIKQLEQSLAEQIEEKEIYINILEQNKAQ